VKNNRFYIKQFEYSLKEHGWGSAGSADSSNESGIRASAQVYGWCSAGSSKKTVL